MKKTLLFLLLAVASAPAAFSQARPGGELSSKDYTGGGTTSSRNTGFGFKAGYNLNSLRGDDIIQAPSATPTTTSMRVFTASLGLTSLLHCRQNCCIRVKALAPKRLAQQRFG